MWLPDRWAPAGASGCGLSRGSRSLSPRTSTPPGCTEASVSCTFLNWASWLCVLPANLDPPTAAQAPTAVALQGRPLPLLGLLHPGGPLAQEGARAWDGQLAWVPIHLHRDGLDCGEHLLVVFYMLAHEVLPGTPRKSQRPRRGRHPAPGARSPGWPQAGCLRDTHWYSRHRCTGVSGLKHWILKDPTGQIKSAQILTWVWKMCKQRKTIKIQLLAGTLQLKGIVTKMNVFISLLNSIEHMTTIRKKFFWRFFSPPSIMPPHVSPGYHRWPSEQLVVDFLSLLSQDTLHSGPSCSSPAFYTNRKLVSWSTGESNVTVK